MQPAHPISIALVDDYQPLRKFLRAYLSNHGFLIACEAEHGQELLGYLEHGLVVPDVCLLDIMMPVMDGYETAKRLKALYPSVKIVAYSSSLSAEGVDEKMLSCGAICCISKSSSPSELSDALRAVFANTHADCTA